MVYRVVMLWLEACVWAFIDKLSMNLYKGFLG